MSWSKIAFGAAKCAKGVVEHEAAFARALRSGITGETQLEQTCLPVQISVILRCCCLPDCPGYMSADLTPLLPTAVQTVDLVCGSVYCFTTTVIRLVESVSVLPATTHCHWFVLYTWYLVQTSIAERHAAAAVPVVRCNGGTAVLVCLVREVAWCTDTRRVCSMLHVAAAGLDSVAPAGVIRKRNIQYSPAPHMPAPGPWSLVHAA